MLSELFGDRDAKVVLRHVAKYAQGDAAGVLSTAIHDDHDLGVRAIAFPRRHTHDLEAVILLPDHLGRYVRNGLQADARH